ncbi:MAG UNVERIFIED_CONTAM: hypothetical protein LVT10_25875 [Anaerolineae bacterium]|jgi:hypothetical protein
MNQTHPAHPDHHYYACSWIVNHHGLDHLQRLADLADELEIEVRVRRMFQHDGLMMYPFTVQASDSDSFAVFSSYVAAHLGVVDWYKVTQAYFEQGIPLIENLRVVLHTMPKWLEHMHTYATYNDDVLAKREKS